MKFRITTDNVIEASGLEDAVRQFATALMAMARKISETDHSEITLAASDGGKLTVSPVTET